jgi:mannose-6-phosphate isomerase-like protein (cupin superfamily)
MTSIPVSGLTVNNRHTDEALNLRRVRRDGEVWIALSGTLPPGREGPPMHVHYLEDEECHVTAGTLSFVVNGREGTVGPGESTTIPRGAPHRWWNAGDELLAFHGYAGPAADFDRYLQAIFDVVNAGPAGRPPLFYLAHVVLRHRRTQAVTVLPGPIQAVLFRVVVGIGTLLGKYRGTDWPGCPSRFREAPEEVA